VSCRTDAQLRELLDDLNAATCTKGRCSTVGLTWDEEWAPANNKRRVSLVMSCQCKQVRLPVLEDDLHHRDPQFIAWLVESLQFMWDLPGVIRCSQCAHPLDWLPGPGWFACPECKRQLAPPDRTGV